MSQGPTQTELESQIQGLVELLVKLMGQAVPVDPRALHAHLQKQASAETTYAKILDDLVGDTEKHPFWGFRIQRPVANGQSVEVALVCVPKVLDARRPEYLSQLAAWTNTYMLATTPMARACWTSCGMTVEFFQSVKPVGSAAAAKPQLLT